MAYRNSSDYFKDIELFIIELDHDKNERASKRMKECFEYINQNKDDWKMFYRKLLLVKDEFGFKFSSDENQRIDDIIEAAKRVMYQM
jgi:hypothetical protein